MDTDSREHRQHETPGCSPRDETASRSRDVALPPAIERWSVLALIRIGRRAGECIDHALEPLGLQLRHLRVLLILQAVGPLSQAALTKPVEVDRTTMVGVVDDLERLGLAERTPDPRNRRTNAIQLTEGGRRMLDRADAALEAAEAEFLHGFTAEERAQFRALVDRLLEPDRERFQAAVRERMFE